MSSAMGGSRVALWENALTEIVGVTEISLKPPRKSTLNEKATTTYGSGYGRFLAVFVLPSVKG